jgi:Fe-S-cluster-containing dehydrogenase component/Ni/Fe-hydrogenase subunit HybB-like protein
MHRLFVLAGRTRQAAWRWAAGAPSGGSSRSVTLPSRLSSPGPLPAAATRRSPLPIVASAPPAVTQWAKLIDHTRCIGCHACSTACKSENEVPLGVHRTYVKYVDVGTFPEARRAFQVTRCNQCAHAPCVAACPTAAMHTRPDGIVDFDKSICIGCKACIAACPYDAIFINPEDQAAEKCNFCAQRLDVGLEPACVVVCPTEAILVGDLADPSSRVARTVAREPVTVRRPEKDTRPKLFYKGAHQATLDPLAAARPTGGQFLWGDQRISDRHVVSGYPAGPGQGPASSAAAVLAWDIPHRMPWDHKVSLYTVTKAIAAGIYLVALALVLFGVLAFDSPVWTFGVPLVGGAFLAATGGLLIADLTQPKRFLLIFRRPQWRSWLVRGAFLIAGYSLVLVLHFLLALAGRAETLLPLALAGAPLALLTAIYTAWLFAQAKARDLWQSALLPPHMAVQTLLAGAAVLLPLAAAEAPEATPALLGGLLVTTLLHLGFVAGEATLPHVSAHATLAAREMTRGRWRAFFWTGCGLLAAVPAACVAPLAAGGSSVWFAGFLALAALAGLLAHEHAYVQAGQSVPLA